VSNLLHTLRGKLSGLTRTDWAFVHFKASLGLLWMIPLVQSGTLRSNTTPVFLWVWAVVTFLGFWVSIVGLVMSAQRFDERHAGFRVEMTGLWLLAAGPIVYVALQIGLWWTTGQPRLVAIAFAYVILAAIATRMVMIRGAAKSRTVIYRYRERREDD
jgi:uncharacterized membrane protein